MSVDEILVYGSYLAFLVIIILAYRFSKRVAIINFVVFLLYTSYLLYGLNFKSEGGSGLFWGASILFFTGIHFLGVLIYLVLKWLKVPQESFFNKKYLLSIILSLGLLALGVLFRSSHWPFGNAILFTGVGLACLTLVLFIVQKMKRETK